MFSRENLSLILFTLALPAILTVVLLGIVWQRPKTGAIFSDQKAHWFDTFVLGLAALVSFFTIEQIWPWELFPVKRALYWIPIGILCFLAAHFVIGKKASFRGLPGWCLWTAIFGITLFLSLRPYLLQLDENWSVTIHYLIFGLLFFASWLFSMGFVAIGRRFPGKVSVAMAFLILCTGALFIFLTGSAKMAHLTGATTGCLGAAFTVLLFVGRADLRVSDTFGFLTGALFSFFFLHGFYAGAHRTPISGELFMFSTPLMGIVLLFTKRPGKTLPRLVALFGWALLAIALAFATLLPSISKRKKEQSELDIYGQSTGLAPSSFQKPETSPPRRFRALL